MMRQLFYFLLAILMLQSCARSFADFTIIQQDHVVPAKASFELNETEVDQILWNIDGVVYTDAQAEHRFLRSGKHEVAVTVNKGNKSKTLTKEIIFNAPTECLVEISTSLGDMLVELYEETPGHRDNFIKLAEEAFYDGTLFHRVIDGFMIQGGDPDSKGASASKRLGGGGPGYQIDAEFNERFVHIKGSLAAARQGDQVNPKKKSSGSQFYIVHGQPVTQAQLTRMENSKGISYSEDLKNEYIEKGGTPFLDGEYTVFGRVIEGWDVIDKIATVKTNRGDRPIEDVTMKISVIR